MKSLVSLMTWARGVKPWKTGQRVGVAGNGGNAVIAITAVVAVFCLQVALLTTGISFDGVTANTMVCAGRKAPVASCLKNSLPWTVHR